VGRACRQVDTVGRVRFDPGLLRWEWHVERAVEDVEGLDPLMNEAFKVLILRVPGIAPVRAYPLRDDILHEPLEDHVHVEQ
jgi:hypothetical protein